MPVEAASPPVPSHLGVLQVEPTDQCNLACRMCAPHAEGWDTVHGVPKGLLDPARFDKILDRLVEEDCRFDHVIFQWLGDPSVHPRQEELVARAGERLRGRVGYLRVDSNFLLLGPDRIERLLATRAPDVPLVLVASLDAATPETYARVKGRDGFALATRNVRALLAARPRHAPGVHVQAQFVVQEGNAHEVGAFLRTWGDAFACPRRRAPGNHDEICLKRLSVGGGGPGQAEADARYDRVVPEAVRAFEGAHAIHGAEGGPPPSATPPPASTGPATEGDARASRRPALVLWDRPPWQVTAGSPTEGVSRAAPRTACPGLWLTPVVRHDGTLQMCCADLGGELALGRMPEQGFRELWFGAKARAWRAAHLAGRFEGACARCGGINWYGLPEGAAGWAIG